MSEYALDLINVDGANEIQTTIAGLGDEAAFHAATFPSQTIDNLPLCHLKSADADPWSPGFTVNSLRPAPRGILTGGTIAPPSPALMLEVLTDIFTKDGGSFGKHIFGMIGVDPTTLVPGSLSVDYLNGSQYSMVYQVSGCFDGRLAYLVLTVAADPSSNEPMVTQYFSSMFFAYDLPSPDVSSHIDGEGDVRARLYKVPQLAFPFGDGYGSARDGGSHYLFATEFVPNAWELTRFGDNFSLSRPREKNLINLTPDSTSQIEMECAALVAGLFASTVSSEQLNDGFLPQVSLRSGSFVLSDGPPPEIWLIGVEGAIPATPGMLVDYLLSPTTADAAGTPVGTIILDGGDPQMQALTLLQGITNGFTPRFGHAAEDLTAACIQAYCANPNFTEKTPEPLLKFLKRV